MLKLWAWPGFAALVLLVLVIDLLSHRRKEEGESHRLAVRWIAVWIGAGLGFNLVVWILLGFEGAHEYLAAYLIEESLSLDNVFVFLVVFQTLQIPARHQHRVLFWGVVGAVILRAAFILAGVVVLNRWSWISFVLGAILLYSAYLALRNKVSDKEKSKVVEWLSSHLPVTQMTERSEFVVLRNGHLLITPMLIALVAIELSDIAFAVDSIPAAFSVSRKPFVIYTSNVFAILGLRAAYVVLARAITKLKYLNLGLAGVLAFAGLKLTLRNFIRVPALASVAVIVAIIAACVWLSIASMGKNDPLRCDPSRGCISHGNDSLRSNDRNHQQIVWDDRLTHELTERLTSPLRQWGKNC